MLTIEKVKQHHDLSKIESPAMFIDKSIIKERFLNLTNLIDNVSVFYSVKTNNHPEILKLLRDLGSGFEVASLKEFETVRDMGVPADKIITGNTLKVPKFIEEAYKYGVNYFAYDSKNEVDKLAKLAPSSVVSLRISVDNTGSEWPLSKKFGAGTSRGLELIKYALEKGLKPQALTFHVGSQCMNPTNWSNALMTVAEIYFLAKRNGIEIKTINLGGGFPSRLQKDVPAMNIIRENINKTIKEIFNGQKINFYIEPGRGIVGESALIVSSVIAKADRGSEQWVSLDVGVYNGLLEAVAGIQYEIISDKELNGLTHKAEMIPYNIGGPTCDSWDTVSRDYHLPKNLEIGDLVYVLNTGAYTISETTNFNGFCPPKVYFIEE